MLELKPIDRPEEFDLEWDAYGLFQDGEWLGFPETDCTNNYTFERLACWEFLKKDEFKDRGDSEYQEYLLSASEKSSLFSCYHMITAENKPPFLFQTQL